MIFPVPASTARCNFFQVCRASPEATYRSRRLSGPCCRSISSCNLRKRGFRPSSREAELFCSGLKQAISRNFATEYAAWDGISDVVQHKLITVVDLKASMERQ